MPCNDTDVSLETRHTLSVKFSYRNNELFRHDIYDYMLQNEDHVYVEKKMNVHTFSFAQVDNNCVRVIRNVRWP